MKAYDPTGEYTPEEVKEALAGVNESRKLSFRYERLDRSNNKIEDIDYISKCTIENNFLADIKRTAKVQMYDEGNFNFQQDRLKPYVRIDMPEDRNYGSKLASLHPVLHYTLNEPAVNGTLATHLPVAGADHSTRETAFPVPIRDLGYDKTQYGLTSTYLYFWSKYVNGSRRTLSWLLEDYRTSNGQALDPEYYLFNIYYAADDTSDLVQVGSETVQFGEKGHRFTIEKPEIGTYFIEARPKTLPLSGAYNQDPASYYPEITVTRPIAIQDISESGATSYTIDYNFGGETLVNNRRFDEREDDIRINKDFELSTQPLTWGSNLPYPQNLDRRTPAIMYSNDKNMTRPGYHVASATSAKAGDKFRIEFIAKHLDGQETNPANIRVGIEARNSSGTALATNDYTATTAKTVKVEELENGWARYVSTPVIPASWTDTVTAAMTIVIPEYAYAFEPTRWAIERRSVKWVKRAPGYVDTTDVDDRSLAIAKDKTQTWFTLDNENIRMDSGLTLNYWQRLSNAADAFTQTARFYANTAYLEITCNRVQHNPAGFVQGTGTYKVKIVSTNEYDQFTFSATLVVPPEHFDVKSNVMAVQLDIENNRISLFKNAKLLGKFTVDSGSAPLERAKVFFDNQNIVNKVEVSFTNKAVKPDAVMNIDDFSVYTRAVLSNDLLEISERGKLSFKQRKGYVEWPMGVFLLSAPNRSMEDGVNVSRSVDAYDQLLVLKEDSYLERFAALKGEKVTDVIDKVLQSTVPPQKIDAESTIWTMTTGVKRETADTVSFPAGTTVSAPGAFVTATDKIVLRGSAISAKMPSTVAQWQIGYYAKNSQYLSAYWRRDGTALYPDGYGAQEIGTATYNPTTHAYLRVREDTVEKYIYYEYSSDGLNWNWWGRFNYTNFIAEGNPLSGNSTTMIGIKMVGAGVATKVRVEGTIATRRFIVDKPDTLSGTVEWEPGTSKLRVINDLLDTINYDSATFDADGVFIAKPYVSPTLRPSEYTYATDSKSMISGDVKQELDLTGVPNAWVLVFSQPDKTPMKASYINENPNSITSTIAVGRRIVDVRSVNEVTSQAVLNSKVMRLAQEASQIYEHIEFETGLMPIHENSDVYTLIIDGLVIKDKYSETSWSMELAAGASMRHKARRTVAI